MLKAPTLPKGYRFKVQKTDSGYVRVALQRKYFEGIWLEVASHCNGYTPSGIKDSMDSLLADLKEKDKREYDGYYPPREDIG